MSQRTSISLRIAAIVLLVVASVCPSITNSGGRARAACAVSDTFPRTVTDARGKTLTLVAPPRRIVSLAPSNTELLYALGLGNRIVGDTTACDYPPEARLKPHVGGFNISLESVEVKNPDLIVAVGSINAKAIAGLEAVRMPVLVIDPRTIPETYVAIRLLGRATGQESQAEQIVKRMEARISAVQKVVARARTRPKVLMAYGDSPIYTTGPGSFIDDAIRSAGGQNIVATSLPGNVISPAAVIIRQPDVIICDPALVPRIKALPGWAEAVPAVRNNRFFYPSAQATLVQPGPRLANATEELARFLHPELFTAHGSPHGK